MSNKSILVVDDSKSDQMIVEFEIEDLDGDIVLYKAFDGQEALEILLSLDEPPTLILLDINMPRMNGIEFLEEYTKHHSGSTVVAMLTSSDDQIDRDRALQFQCVEHYFVKPLCDDNLKVIERALS